MESGADFYSHSHSHSQSHTHSERTNEFDQRVHEARLLCNRSLHECIAFVHEQCDKELALTRPHFPEHNKEESRKRLLLLVPENFIKAHCIERSGYAFYSCLLPFFCVAVYETCAGIRLSSLSLLIRFGPS